MYGFRFGFSLLCWAASTVALAGPPFAHPPVGCAPRQRPCPPTVHVHVPKHMVPCPPQGGQQETVPQPETQYFSPPSRGGVTVGESNFIGIEGPEIRFPEFRLALPSIRLPAIFRGRREARMELERAEAYPVSRVQQEFSFPGGPADQPGRQETGPGLPETAPAKPSCKLCKPPARPLQETMALQRLQQQQLELLRKLEEAHRLINELKRDAADPAPLPSARRPEGLDFSKRSDYTQQSQVMPTHFEQARPVRREPMLYPVSPAGQLMANQQQRDEDIRRLCQRLEQLEQRVRRVQSPKEASPGHQVRPSARQPPARWMPSGETDHTHNSQPQVIRIHLK